MLLVGIALATSTVGCDQIFRLQAPPIDSGVAVCAYATLAPDGDEDRDGVLNANDQCPTVPTHGLHDEDLDGMPDECDLCPELALAGDDVDCDAVGAACDPDEAIEHTQTFYGFGSDTGLSLIADGKITGDAFHFTQGAAGYGGVRVTQRTPAPGSYEVHAIVSGIDATYWDLGILVTDVAASIEYAMQISVVNRTVSLGISEFRGDNLARVMDVGTVGTTATFTLRATIVGADVQFELLGDARASVSATIPTLPAAPLPPGSITWGIAAYRDLPASPAFRIEVPYMRRIAPKI